MAILWEDKNMQNNQIRSDGTRVWSAGNADNKRPAASGYNSGDSFTRPKIGVWHAPDIVQKMKEKGLQYFDDSSRERYRSE
jgi:hypothetical protein